MSYTKKINFRRLILSQTREIRTPIRDIALIHYAVTHQLLMVIPNIDTDNEVRVGFQENGF